MIRPNLLAKFNREAEDAVAAIVELTHAADLVIYQPWYTNVERQALGTIIHAIRHLSCTASAVTRVVASEAERDASPAGRPYYSACLRLELSRMEEEK